ncbi:MAG: flagellar biosynthesis protein FlhF [Motiliproteus sp.]|nr:flagellar biosynthesis protein FlhF [Motiliproteus sp.]MCW9051751.1 flagellar biosynthesis protein FlhF [Motiliproteus sp.]
MKVKRFFAPDMSSAMRLVRDEVGPDAVILSNSSVAGGVEVVVALEYSETVPQRQAEARADGRRDRQVTALVGTRKPQRLRTEMGRTRAALASGQEQKAVSEPPYLSAKKDGQLGLDDAVWDDVLASLEKKRNYSENAEVAEQQARLYGKPGVRRPVKSSDKAVPAGILNRKRPSAVATKAETFSGNGAGASGEKSVAANAVAGSDAVSQQSLQQMRSEIDELKTLLRRQAVNEAPVAQQRLGNPLRDRIYKRLLRLGLVESLAERLVQAIEPDAEVDRAWKIALSRLVDALPTVGENIADRGGILAFVGATGVGKTTTIGKLAAQYVLKHGSSSVALVTTDAYRIAAHEQLRTFGRILDIPVRVVDEARALDDALHSLRDKRLVLVDTAGLSTSPNLRQEQLDMLNASSYRIKKYLVLPCTAQQRVLQVAYDSFKDLGLNGAILSKIDESVSLGEAISMVVEQRLPVAYLGDGQKIPDNIEVARANTLVSRAVVLAEEQAKLERARNQAERVEKQSPSLADLGNVG